MKAVGTLWSFEMTVLLIAELLSPSPSPVRILQPLDDCGRNVEGGPGSSSDQLA
jgi:hypothetical protein